MTITLHGLTKQQYQIADMIWSCASQEDVDRLIRNLPQAYRRDAQTIHQLMIAAVMDQHEEITDDVKDLIRSIADR
jgi:23S rRNA C2498 (ribose-2'-O)-methylase RlmM